MKYILIFLAIIFIGCDKHEKVENDKENWSNRIVDISNADSLIYGKSYLSVYSQMYSFTQSRLNCLPVFVSLRNVSELDTIYISRADFFNVKGVNIKSYVDLPIFISPMETLEIIIDQNEIEAGIGSKFLFEWKIPINCPEPIFEGIMRSVEGSHAMSFITRSDRIN